MIVSKITTVEDALQRILFWSSLFWRSQHLLVGIGRLDKLLEGLCFEDENHNFFFMIYKIWTNIVVYTFYLKCWKIFLFSKSMLAHHGSMITLEHYLNGTLNRFSLCLGKCWEKFTFFIKSKQSKKKFGTSNAQVNISWYSSKLYGICIWRLWTARLVTCICILVNRVSKHMDYKWK